jgi:hypothetical protein
MQVSFSVGLVRVCFAAFWRLVVDIGVWMILVSYRCCLFNCFILILFANDDTKCFSFYKSFFSVFFHFFYVCKRKDGAFFTLC